MKFDDDNQPSMVNGMLNGMIDPNNAESLNTRIAYEQGATIPIRHRGVYHVVAPSQPATEGFTTMAVKVGNVQ